MADDNVTCRYCGRTLGNAGARAQHEAACPHNPENHPPSKGIEVEAGGVPVRQQATPTEVEAARGGAGTSAADTLFVLFNYDEMPPEARREAVNQGTGFLGSLLNRYLDLRDRSNSRREERARQAELEPVVELPTCECGYQFGTDELGGRQVRCPDCNMLFNVEMKGAHEQ